jgi:hypothetical protein
MPLPQFDKLPSNACPDLSPYLIHLTKNTKAEDDYSALIISSTYWRVGRDGEKASSRT